jgi:hypothetical protein
MKPSSIIWNPLWQMDDVQKSTMANTYSDIFVGR